MLGACGIAGALILAAMPAFAQHPPVSRDAASPGDALLPPEPAQDEIGFSADQLLYDSDRDVVTATGNVAARRGDNVLKADSLTWDRNTGEVMARGDVSVESADGITAYGDEVRVDEDLRDGIVRSLLIVTQEGDRIAAVEGARTGPIFVLDTAAYTACRVIGSDGCPKDPSWQIKAARVIYNSDTQKVRYSGARIELFGVPLIPLPGLAHSISDGATSGLLVPEIGIDALNGVQASLPYYLALAPNRDLTLTGHLFTEALPMAQARYRALVNNGAYQVTAYATHGRRSDALTTADPESRRAFRGYVDASSKFQLTPDWSVSGSLRRVTDRTFLDRYDISRDDRLRSSLLAERIGERSYLSIQGWSFQTLRAGDPQGKVPVAIPAIDYRLRMRELPVPGSLDVQANSLSILRTDGQDTQRAFASLNWTLRQLTPLGQELAFTAYARGDVYHSAENALTDTLIYRGDPGWQTRGIAALSADMRWPFAGDLMGGTQYVAPRVQVVVAPPLANLNVPNEDARAVDLEDSNLFALNRFPGYDRFEDSVRLTYGVEYRYDRPWFSLEATVGQSYRLNDRETILPDGTGLADRLSDVVGRVDLRYRDVVTLTHRFRLDKDDFAVRRNEVEATVGSRSTYAKASYVRLNRDIDSIGGAGGGTLGAIEDLQDVEEMRLAGRVAFARYWSLFGSTSIDLTGADDDPATGLDGFTPVRHRVGIAYQDECLEVGLTWQREYQSFGDAGRGNSYLVRVAFRNLGL